MPECELQKTGNPSPFREGVPSLMCPRPAFSFVLAPNDNTFEFVSANETLDVSCRTLVQPPFPPIPPWLLQAEGEAVICGLPFHCSVSNKNALILPRLSCRAVPSSQAPRGHEGQRERDSLPCIIHTSASLSIFNVQRVAVPSASYF